MECFLQLDGSFKTSGRTILQSELSPAVRRHALHKLGEMLAAISIERRWEGAIRKENSLVWGMPTYRDNGKRLIIETSCGYVGHSNPLALPIHERGAYKLAGKTAFYVHHISRNDGRTLILNRSSIRLPELIMKQFCTEAGIIARLTCTRRVIGSYSEIKASRSIPATIITRAEKELRGEKIRIKP